MNELELTGSQQVLLVVYAVLWAGLLPTFGRLRVFAINEIFRRSTWRRGRTWRRFGWGVLFANIFPAALLVALLMWLPDPGGYWGVAVAALAGLSPAAFPRFLHALIASNQRWSRFYEYAEWKAVLREWESRPGPELNNAWYAHALSGLLMLALPAVAVVVGAILK